MLTRRRFVILAGAMVVPALSSCGDTEAQKAQAFAEFLQKRILDRPGVHIPILNDQERASIGRFEADFQILKTFNDDLSESVKDYAKSVRPPPHMISAADLPKYRADLSVARDICVRTAASLDGALARAETARAKLKQPEAVKPNFEAAYDQLVRKPEKAWREVAPLALAALDAEIALADFIAAHQADIQSVGSMLQTSKPAVRKELEALIATYSANASKLNEVRRKFELAVRGR